MRSQGDHEAHIAVLSIDAGPHALPVLGAICKPMASINWEVYATLFHFSIVGKLTLYFLSKRYRGNVLTLIIYMIGLLAMLAVVRSFFEITVLVFSPILQAALATSAMTVRCRGSSPSSAPNTVVGEDFEAPMIPLKISPLSLSTPAIVVFYLTLLQQTTGA